MNIRASFIRLAGAIAAILLFTQSAYAYLDPGTGSLILQAMVGGIAAAGVAFATMRHQITDFLDRILGKKPKDDEQNLDDTE